MPYLSCKFAQNDIVGAYQLKAWIKYCLEDFEKGINDLNESIYLNPKDNKRSYLIFII